MRAPGSAERRASAPKPARARGRAADPTRPAGRGRCRRARTRIVSRRRRRICGGGGGGPLVGPRRAGSQPLRRAGHRRPQRPSPRDGPARPSGYRPDPGPGRRGLRLGVMPVGRRPRPRFAAPAATRPILKSVQSIAAKGGGTTQPPGPRIIGAVAAKSVTSSH
jgi:hypothetical protein